MPGTRPRVGMFSMTTLTALSALLALTVAAAPAATVSCTPASGLQPQLRVSGYEQATIHDTNYPVPSHALFVANNGSDHNPGTKRAPFATIRRAITAVHAGGTIVVRGGVYRESLGTLPRRLTIQAYPHETPWVRGSTPVSRFAASGDAWAASWSSPFCDSCYPTEALDPAHPTAGLPEQVFVDGLPLGQVTARSALRPGTFYVDHKAGKLVLANNPAGHVVEATRLADALTVGSAGNYSTIRGIGFEHWGTTYRGAAAVTVNGSHVTFDNDTFAWSAARALGIFGSNDVIIHSAIVDNGMAGVNAHADRALDFEQNEVAFSNFEHWSIAPSTFAAIAGVKNTNSHSAVFRANRFHDNDGNALWFDTQSVGQTVVENTIVLNSGHGLVVEISSDSILAGNVVADNGRDGLKLSGASNAQVWNNTVVGNGWAQARIDEDPRHTTGPVTLDNNILISGSRSLLYVLYSYDIDQPGPMTTLQMITADDHNLYGRTNTHRPSATVFAQTSANVCRTYDTVGSFRTAAHRELASASADWLPLTHTFADPAHENYTIKSGATLPKPTELPQSVADALRTSRNVSHVGA